MRKALMYPGLVAAALLAVPVGAQPLPAPVSAPDQVPSSQGLQLSEVLASSRRFAPAILEALANTRAADGRVLASEGAFDLLFSGEGFSRIAGFYDGTYVQGKAIQPLTNNGGQLEASYRVSRGDFPVYEDYSFTDRLGELKVRGVFALLRDRYIDDRRFGQRNALIERDIAGLDALLIAIGVQQRAIQAYGQWVAAGQQVRVYRALVGLAQDRQEGIRRQVQLGARASAP
ncbi:TolC family protein [Blastomonas sp. UPD001]|uniref:TolC family protein n=1 Tax=Blastomonas sp. UPD001 TaxID=2217673 RepID=UPI000E34117A|nr:TolC family protein [Blastomonas sp. UPD001]